MDRTIARSPRGRRVNNQKKEDRKARVLEAIAAFSDEFGYPPSYRDLAKKVELAHSAVFYVVEELRTDGLINERHPQGNWHSRAITLTDAGRAAIHGGAVDQTTAASPS